MASNMDLSAVRSALPSLSTGTSSSDTGRRQSGRQSASLTPINEVDDDENEMDVDLTVPQEWTPDEASLNYLKSLTRKSTGHRRARRVPVTYTWIKAKFQDLPAHKRDRLLAGHSVEDALADYNMDEDDDACLQVSKFGVGSSLAIQACIRDHIQLMRSKSTSKQAFPTGRVSSARRAEFIANRFRPENPDLGSTADKCCPDLDGTPRSPWNLTFCESVAKDFVAKVSEGAYIDYDLPEEAKEEAKVVRRVKVCVSSMIKKDRKLRRLNTADKLAFSKTSDKYMQRRRVKHEARLRACDTSPKYQNFYGLIKVVGPDGNSDEETDNECGVVPAPLKVFPLKWRSRAYQRLLHNLDLEVTRKDTHPLLHAGPIRPSARATKRARVCTAAANTAGKFLPVSCPPGKPSQFYDATFIRDATAQGFLPSLRVGTGYPHSLPGA